MRVSGVLTLRDGTWVPVRAWDLPIKERFEAHSVEDARAFVTDVTRKPQWRGR